MRRIVATCCVTLPLATACAFLIDFDELQRGNEITSKDGGSGGKGSSAGGSAGTGGSDEAGATGGANAAGGAQSDASTGDSGACPAGCDDKDSCTVDTCTSAGACTHTHTPGIVSDGLSVKALARTFHRVTLAAHKDQFYLSALKTTVTGKDVLLHSFGAKETTLGVGKNLTNLAAFNGLAPVSAAGIAAGDADPVIKLYVAMGQTIGQPAQVWQVTTDTSLAVLSAVPAAADNNYAGSATTYPIAWAPSGSEVFAAWPGATAGVFLHHASNPTEPTGVQPTFGGTTAVTSLSP